MYLFKSPPRALLLFSQYVVYSLSSDLLFCKSMNYSPARLLCPWDFPSKNTGVGSHAFLQGIFLTQGSNLGLPYKSNTFSLGILSLPILNLFHTVDEVDVS